MWIFGLFVLATSLLSVSHEEALWCLESFKSSNREFKESLNLLESSFQNGHDDPRICRALGRAYFFGRRHFLKPDYKKAFHYNSAGNDPQSMYFTSLCYAQGLGVSRSTAKALIYLNFAAQTGSIEAQLALGYRYAAGIGVQTSCSNSRDNYYGPAKKVATHYASNNHYQTPKALVLTDIKGSVSSQQNILDYYEYSADREELNTLVVLGQIFYEGYNGTPIDYAQALKYFTEAAERGSSTAKSYLGEMHYYGHGVPKNPGKAFKFYREASVEGNSLAKNGLGVLYRDGIEVMKDEEEALRLFIQAADDGLAEGQYNAGCLMHKLFPITHDDKSLSFLVRAYQQGHTLAQFEMARRNIKNNLVCAFTLTLLRGVVQKGPELEMFQMAFDDYHSGDKDVALAKFIFLADHGHETAQFNAALILIEANSDIGYRRALVYLHRSAAQGNIKARLKLGDIFYHGKGLPAPDMVTAYLAYKEAYAHNSPQASFNLGYMYEHGLGVPEDYHLARRYYDAAATIDSKKNPEAWLPVRMAVLALELKQAKNKVHKLKMLIPYVVTGLLGLISINLLLRRYLPRI